MVNIPSDLRKNKEKIIGEMDLRESVCLFLALSLAISILYYVRVVIGYRNLAVIVFLLIPFVLPFLVYGFKRINGMRIDDYIKVFINNNILANKERLNVQTNDEVIVKEKKYELLRYYKLINKNELVRLKEYLKENKKLILTEYIDYNNENIVIFRLDGKDLIYEQIKRNKEAIENKIKEIKDLINNEIKVVKKESFNKADFKSIGIVSKDYNSSNKFFMTLESIRLTKEEKNILRQAKDKIKKQNKENKIIFKNNKKEKLKELYSKLLSLRKEKRYLQNKTFYDLKDEVDIFEDLSNIVAKRLITNINNYKKPKTSKNSIINKNLKTQNMVDEMLILRERIKNDDRVLYQLHLFNKESFRQIIENITDKIVFINKDDKVDVYTFGLNFDINKNIQFDTSQSNSNAPKIVIDINKIDKALGLYDSSILSLEARDYYNHYREINKLMEII